MMEEFSFLTNLYVEIYDWLATATPGNCRSISFFKYYDKNVWQKIKTKIIELENKTKISKIEKGFLKCKYEGKAYRVMNYSSRKQGHICAINMYQSYSKDIEGVNKVNVLGTKILINVVSTKETYAIDIFELLIFMKTNKLININDEKQKRLKDLLMYEQEKEVVIPTTKENILNVNIVDPKNQLLRELTPEQWFREKI